MSLVAAVQTDADESFPLSMSVAAVQKLLKHDTNAQVPRSSSSSSIAPTIVRPALAAIQTA